MNKLIDRFQRVIEYIRISITDRCNLNCIYCSPRQKFNFIPKEEILTYEEILRILKIGARYGIKKVRITGGEPLLRKNLPDFIRMISEIKEIETIALSTNGLLLKVFAEKLKESGLNRVNISLDTLIPSKFKMITGSDKLSSVFQGINEVKRAGIKSIRINTVVMRDLNSDEVLDLIDFAYENNVILRFIEYMPNCVDKEWKEKFFSKDEVLNLIKSKFDIEVIQPLDVSSPARYYILGGRGQKIGIISPITHNFCGKCNRLRLTADGNIMACLQSQERISVKLPLRNGASDGELMDIIKGAISRKGREGGGTINLMHEIGG